MKKITSLMFVFVLLLSTLSLVGCVEAETNTNQGNDVAANISSEVSSEEEVVDNTLGDYVIDIKSCRLAKDYEGKDIVIVTYGFTNNSEEAASFALAVETTAYQDGIGLNESYFADDIANYSADNQLKDIKKGASLDVEVAYELNDNQTAVEVEVKEFFSFDDKTLTKVFEIQ